MASPKKPVLGSEPLKVNFPVLDKSSISAQFKYSFKYFNQIRFFGLDGVDNKWFISLFDKLKDFANTHPEDLQKNYHLKDTWRYHIIDWESTGIPIKRSDLNWLGKNIVENEEEFPLWQFQVSTARGRIIGFWHEDTFNIVLLDPLHNLQPSQKFGYAVDDCYPLSNQYDSLIRDIEKVLQERCTSGLECLVHQKLKQVPTKVNQVNAYMAYIDDEYLSALNEILERKTFTELIEEVIISNT